MNKRSVLNLVLIAAVLALGLLAYLEPGKEAPPAPATLTALRPEQVERLRIEAPGKAVIELAKEGGSWRITAPIAVPANEFRIDPLLRLSGAASHARFAPAPQDLAKYGLDPPQGRLRLNDLELVFGGTEPLDQRRYVMVGADVHLISDHYYYQFRRDLPDFVSRRLVPEDRSIERIVLPDLRAARAASGTWEFTPAAPDLSADRVNHWVEEWRRAEALEVSRYPGEAGQGMVAISFAGGAAPLQFQILEREPELVLGRRDIGMRYHFTAEQAARLMKVPEENVGPEGEVGNGER